MKHKKLAKRQHLHAPLCVIIVPNKGCIASYATFIWHNYKKVPYAVITPHAPSIMTIAPNIIRYQPKT